MNFVEWFDTKIFHHCGRKLQLVAMISAIFLAMTIILSAFVLFAFHPLTALLTLAFGFLYTFLLALPLYAFGQLIDDVHSIRQNSCQNAVATQDAPDVLPELPNL